jgi:hypothetical protein
VTGSSPLVALIHATPVSISPAKAAFERAFPEAELWHLLDDRLAGDADRVGALDPALRRRMISLIRHAVGGGAAPVQLTCSMYGPVTTIVTQLWEIPVHGSDEQMFRELAWSKPARVGILGSLESAAADSARRLADVVPETEIVPITAAGAAEAAANDDRERTLAALAAAATPHVGEVDAFVLAQYSLSSQCAALERVLGAPVLSPPLPAAQELRRRMLGEVAV